ncbi:hypothetical protein [Brevundimonas sp.]|uniref:hypothetical protein n=1 Tax=Brevundimonas sp. TaxID=1871086 RepID=UPI002ED964AD
MPKSPDEVEHNSLATPDQDVQFDWADRDPLTIIVIVMSDRIGCDLDAGVRFLPVSLGLGGERPLQEERRYDDPFDPPHQAIQHYHGFEIDDRLCDPDEGSSLGPR